MPTFADVNDHNDSLVRKALSTIVAVAPATTAPITSILDSADGTLAALPAGYTPLGRLSEDGTNFARETELSEIFGNGSTGPARSDLRRVTRRASLTLLEVRRKGLELAQGMDLSGVTPTLVPATTGNPELTWDEPDMPDYPYMRLIVIARDITAGGEMYIARHALMCKVTEIGEEVWSDQDQAMTQPLTFTFFTDPNEGTPLRHFRGGPGYSEVMQDEGFPAAA